MPDKPPIRVFIASGEASRLERKTHAYAIKKHASRPVEIVIFNGSHNAIEREGQEPVPAPMSLKAHYQQVTEFSNYRFLIPQVCGFQGRAIYVDPDMVTLKDIAELFDADLGDNAFLAKSEAYGHDGSDRWGLSVMLMDCARCKFDLELYTVEMEKGLYTFTDMHQMTPKFLALHPFKIGKLDPRWNSFDFHDADTRLIHYTDLMRQPWKYPGHPYGDLWFRYFKEAQDAGAVTPEDIELTMLRSFVRPNLMEGNNPSVLKKGLRFVKRKVFPRG